MIANQIDLENTLKELKKVQEINIMDLSKKMSSDEFNFNNLTIYENLNLLYTKYRLLEDVKQYMENNLLDLIAKKKKKFAEILTDIQKNMDIVTDDAKGYIPLSYSWSKDKIIDRDGSFLPIINDPFFNKNNTLDYSREAEIISIIQNSKDTPYICKITDSSCYITFNTDNVISIEDTVKIIFNKASIINYISILHNEEISINAYYINKDKEHITVKLNQYIEPITISELYLDINTKNYKKIEKEEDKKVFAADTFALQSSDIFPIGTTSEIESKLANYNYQNEVKSYTNKGITHE